MSIETEGPEVPGPNAAESDPEITLESVLDDEFNAAQIAQLLNELAAKDRTIAELRIELEQFRAGKTYPPPNLHPDEPTANLKCEAEKASMLSEISNLALQVSTMNRELGQFHLQLEEYKPIMKQVAAVLADGYCDHCPNRPPMPPLHSLPPPKAQGAE
jgi:hypothetical protein